MALTAEPEETQPEESADRRAFRRFLAWLDEGTDSGGATYLEMHRRLAAYFDRKNCSSPQDLADETLSRVSRRLEEEGAITGASPARYCYIVARFVFLEHRRHAASSTALGDAEPPCPPGAGAAEQKQALLLSCLEQCLH